MPVLRETFPDFGVEPGPRGAAEPGGNEHVEQRRLLLPPMQRKERGADAARSAHAAHCQTGQAEAKSGNQSHVVPHQVSQLEAIPGSRLLDGGIEVTALWRRAKSEKLPVSGAEWQAVPLPESLHLAV